MIEASITPLDKLISEFRLLNAKDSVTPQSLGYILHRLALAVRDASIDPDLNAGVIDARLDNIIADHNILEEWVVDQLQNLPKDSAMPRLFCETDGQTLHLRNAEAYLDAGYIPFLLRPTSKHRTFHYRDEDGRLSRAYESGSVKGWHQMFSKDYVYIDRENNNCVEFRTKKKTGAIVAASYPKVTITSRERKNYTGQSFRVPVISWGKNTIDLVKRSTFSSNIYDTNVQWRTIRLPFAIVFAKPDFNYNAQSVTQAHIVSNLATFSLIFPSVNPNYPGVRPIPPVLGK